MSDKAGWLGLGHLVDAFGKPAAKPLATSGRTCANGHPMAADWVKCPYCEAERNAAGKTQVASADATPGTPETAGTGRRETSVDPGLSNADDAASRAAAVAGGSGADRRATRVADDPQTDVAATPAPAPAPAPRPAPTPARKGAGGRRLTGIVVTYTWSALGDLYEVRDGRNYGGSGTVSTEDDRVADILVADDRMSSAHFLILCQSGNYRIGDVNSTNGTFVNGVLVDALGIVLQDNAVIKAGDTVFLFKKLAPPSTSAQAPAASTTPATPADPDTNEEPG